MISKRGLNASLDRRRSIIIDKYSLDEIQLIIFKQGFNKGYESGYMQIQEGITTGASEKIELIEN